MKKYLYGFVCLVLLLSNSDLAYGQRPVGQQLKTYRPASQAEAEAGTEAALRSFSPLRVRQGAAATITAQLGAAYDTEAELAALFGAMQGTHTYSETIGGCPTCLDTVDGNDITVNDIAFVSKSVQVDSGTTDGTTASKLVDSTQNLLTTASIGDVVHNTTNDTYASVTAVDSNTQLSLSADIMTTGEVYTISSWWTLQYQATLSNKAESDPAVVAPDTNRYKNGVLQLSSLKIPSDTASPPTACIEGEVYRETDTNITYIATVSGNPCTWTAFQGNEGTASINTTGTIQGRGVPLSYDASQTLTAATHRAALVRLTVAGEIMMWDCTSSNLGDFVTLWARDAEKIEVVPAAGDQFFLFDGTGIGVDDELDMAATAGTKVTLYCFAENEWHVYSETSACADGGAAD